ncbi:MAG: hypothetical protein ABF260_07795 [Flavobacteriaceae bacterium]
MRDKNGCGESELEVAVIELPKFFSPNNDEENDTMKRMIHGQFEVFPQNSFPLVKYPSLIDMGSLLQILR